MAEESTEIFEARWKGVVDLDAEALEAITLDGLMFAVVAFRVEEVGGTKISRGRRCRKDVFSVEDARVLLGASREQAVQFLAGKEMEFAQNDVRVPVEIHELVVPPLVASSEEEDHVVMSIHDYKKDLRPEPSSRDGAKVAKFSEDNDIALPASGDAVEQVGSIRSPGYQGKDKVLRKFLERN